MQNRIYSYAKIGGIILRVKYNEKDKSLLLQITEEIDHHVAERIRTRADFEIQRYIPKGYFRL